MFVILGSPRSGTTLLATTLDQSPHITVPHETDFIVPAAFLYSRIREERLGKQLILATILNSEMRYSVQESLSPGEIEAAIERAPYELPAILSSIYDAVAQKTGASIAGDRSPNDVFHYLIFEKTGLFSSSIKFIHIVRDIRDVMLSLSQMPWKPERVERYYARMWNDFTLSTHRLLEDAPQRYRLVRYEDLVCRPETVVRALTDFLDVPYHAAMLDHTRRGIRYRQASYHTNLSNPINATRMNAWRTELPAAIRELCETQAAEALKCFGYI
ncbi:MAG TPA: sulfotransferase [Bryobacteraceae bacterium]|nr:sulfotransferase [Bryobacteraceae bacterium]